MIGQVHGGPLQGGGGQGALAPPSQFLEKIN